MKDKNPQDETEKQSSFPTISLPDSSAVIGGEIGPYRLLRVLGEGGFGIVYLAEQKHPVKRTVALKVIKPGMDTKQVIARFEAERQALALLEHPNIARVYNAGSTEIGRPYFAMEYIKGSPITEYCDHHKVSIKERLELFIQVCEAVQHAHQKGIIHRDIKPSNIVVTSQDGKAVPKVIDFGVAKAISMPLTEKTMFTQQGQLIGTPEYMSPEQADLKEKDIDTRTDIYSLGVVLYELLAGTLPFEPETLREGGYAEIQRIIREQEPPRPSTRLSGMGENATKVALSRQIELSTLVKSLHKELEWIPLMAIRKERDQRYKTASDLAEDVQNYLDGNPLVAGPESAVYKFKKFVKKRKGLVAAVGSIAAILLISLGAVINSNIKKEIALSEAVIARNEANAARSKAEANNETLVYAEYIDQAQESFDFGNLTRMDERLNKCDTKLRSWEWDYLDWLNCSNRKQLNLVGPTSSVGSIDYSSNNKYIVGTSSNDNTIWVWDSTTGDLLWNRVLRNQGLMEVACSPTEPNLFAICYENGDVVLWDINSSKPKKEHNSEFSTGSSNGGDLAFSPDGNSIVVGSGNGMLQLWNINDEQQNWSEDQQNPIYWIDFSKEHIASAGEKIIKIWDVSGTAEPVLLEGHSDSIRGICFSPDGQYLVSGSYDRTVRIWDVKTGHELQKWNVGDPVTSIAYSSDGKYIAVSGYYRGITLRDANTGQKVWFPQEKSGSRSGLTFSPDSKALVFQSPNGELKCYSTMMLYNFQLLGHGNWDSSETDPVNSIAVSGNNKIIVSGHENGLIKLWEMNSGKELLNVGDYAESISIVSINFEGSLVVTGTMNGNIEFWDNTGKLLKSFSAHTGQVTGIEINANEDKAFSSGVDGKIIAWDLLNLEEVQVRMNLNEGVSNMDLSPDGVRIATGGKDKMLRVWDTSSGNELFSIEHEDVIVDVAFDQSNKFIVSASVDGNIRIWSSETGESVSHILSYESDIIPVVFSPDSMRIISSINDDIRIWDFKTGQKLLTLNANGKKESSSPANNINSLAFSSDKNTIIAGLWNGNIVLYKNCDPVGGYGPWNTTGKARTVVDQLYQQDPSYYDIIEQLTLDMELDTDIRMTAIDIAQARKQEDIIQLCQEIVDLEDIDARWNTSSYDKAMKSLEDFLSKHASELKSGANGDAIFKQLAKALFLRGAKEQSIDNAQVALSCYKKSLEYNPKSAESLDGLSWLMTSSSDKTLKSPQVALDYAIKACELTNWNHWKYLATVAAAYSEMGEFKEAVKWQQKAIDLIPENEESDWLDNLQYRLKLYSSNKSYHIGSPWSFSSGELVAQWNFDDADNKTVFDSSGNGLDGRLIGNASIEDDPERGGVLSLDGKRSYVDFGNDWKLDISGSITIMGWFKSNNVENRQMIISKGLWNDFAWLVELNPYDFQGEKKLNEILRLPNDINNFGSNQPLTSNKWYHFAISYDGDNRKIYINGIYDNHIPANGNIFVNNRSVFIGTWNRAGSRFFDGLIDDVRIYSRALSAEEISELYKEESVKP